MSVERRSSEVHPAFVMCVAVSMCGWRGKGETYCFVCASTAENLYCCANLEMPLNVL